jgi:transposase
MSEKRTRTRALNNKTTTGFCISDELWEVLQPLLPEHRNTHPLGGGRPRRPDRESADAIFYVLRTEYQWKALDATDLVPGSTAGRGRHGQEIRQTGVSKAPKEVC